MAKQRAWSVEEDTVILDNLAKIKEGFKITDGFICGEIKKEYGIERTTNSLNRRKIRLKIAGYEVKANKTIKEIEEYTILKEKRLDEDQEKRMNRRKSKFNVYNLIPNKLYKVFTFESPTFIRKSDRTTEQWTKKELIYLFRDEKMYYFKHPKFDFIETVLVYTPPTQIKIVDIAN